MLQYIDNIILPYVAKARDDVGADMAALVIMDNFKGQTTQQVIPVLGLQQHSRHMASSQYHRPTAANGCVCQQAGEGVLKETV